LDIRLSKKGRFEDHSIAPMILQPFVENAFKHGISKDVDNQWLEIRIKLDDDILNFYVKNPRSLDSKTDKTEYTEGIGLKNVQKRLGIIYPERHDLKIQEDRDTFTINLQLKLDHE